VPGCGGDPTSDEDDYCIRPQDVPRAGRPSAPLSPNAGPSTGATTGPTASSTNFPTTSLTTSPTTKLTLSPTKARNIVEVTCGSHSAPSCAECPFDNGINMGGGWCNGDCRFINNQCITEEEAGNNVVTGVVVSCGGHNAPSCVECPNDNGIDRGQGWCNGVCFWNVYANICEEVTIQMPTPLVSTIINLPYTYSYPNGKPPGCCGGYYDDPNLDILNSNNGEVPNYLSQTNSIEFNGNTQGKDYVPELDLGSPQIVTEIRVSYIVNPSWKKYAPESLVIKGSLERGSNAPLVFTTTWTDGFPTAEGGHTVVVPTLGWGAIQYIELSEVSPLVAEGDWGRTVMSRITVHSLPPTTRVNGDDRYLRTRRTPFRPRRVRL